MGETRKYRKYSGQQQTELIFGDMVEYDDVLQAERDGDRTTAMTNDLRE